MTIKKNSETIENDGKDRSQFLPSREERIRTANYYKELHKKNESYLKMIDSVPEQITLKRHEIVTLIDALNDHLTYINYDEEYEYEEIRNAMLIIKSHLKQE